MATVDSSREVWWLVSGHNGDNLIRVGGPNGAEPWRWAVEKARTASPREWMDCAPRPSRSFVGGQPQLRGHPPPRPASYPAAPEDSQY